MAVADAAAAVVVAVEADFVARPVAWVAASAAVEQTIVAVVEAVAVDLVAHPVYSSVAACYPLVVADWILEFAAVAIGK